MTLSTRSTIRFGLLGAFAATALCACSSTTAGGGSDGSRTSSAPGSVASSAPASASTPSSASVGTGSAAPADFTALLLSVGDVGGGFVRTESNTEDSPLPCTPDQPGVLTQVPPSGQGQIDFTNAKQDAFLSERVVRFASAADAAKALSVARAGLACATADVGGTKLGIVGPNDIRSTLTANNIDSADDWQLRSEQSEAEMILVRIDDTVLQVQFAALPGHQPSDVDPSQVLSTAVAKVINGG